MKIAVTMNDGSLADLGRVRKTGDAEYLIEYLLYCGNVKEVNFIKEEEDEKW